jgi:rhodanese-related sulfurtransferase
MLTASSSALRWGILLAFAVVALLQGACGGGEISGKDVERTTIERVLKARASTGKNAIVLIDARSPQDFAAKHIPDAINRPVTTFSLRRGDIDPAIEKFKLKVVYGDDPGSAVAEGVVKRMLFNGYEGVYWFAGGLSEWVQKGHPVQGGAATGPAAAQSAPPNPPPTQ